jgi:hypothetical protein
MSSAVATQTADLSTALRIAANEKFAARDFAGAAAGYSAALEAATDAQAAVSALSNRAACWLRLGVPVRALDDTWAARVRAEAAGGAVLADSAYAKAILRRVAAFEALGAIPAALELVSWALVQAPAAVSRGPVAAALHSAGQRVSRADNSQARAVHEPCPRPPPAACKALKPTGDGPPSRRFSGAAVLSDGVYVAGGCGKRGPALRCAFEQPLADCWRLPLPPAKDGEWRWERVEAPPAFAAAPGPCVAAACGDAPLVLLPLVHGGVLAYTPADREWRVVLKDSQMPPGGVACVASDGSGAGLLLLTQRGALFRIALADGAATELAPARNSPSPPRLGGTLLVVANGDDVDVLLRGGLETVGNISLDDCWALRVRTDAGGMTAVGSWRRVDGDGGGVPPPPMSYCPAVALGGNSGAVAALVGGVSEVLPGGSCASHGCHAPEIRPQLHLLRPGGAGWAPVRYTGDTPTTWASALAAMPGDAKGRLLLVCAGHNGFDDEAPTVALFQLTLPTATALAAAVPTCATPPATSCVAEMLAADGPCAVDTTSPTALAVAAAMCQPRPPPWPGAAAFEAAVEALVYAPVDEADGWCVAWSAQSADFTCISVSVDEDGPARKMMGLVQRPPRAVDLAWVLLSLCSGPRRCRPAFVHFGARCRHLLPLMMPMLARLGIVPHLEMWVEAASKSLRHKTSAWGFNGGPDTERCLACGKRPRGALKKCAGCHSAPYCSAECSTADWPEHRPACVLLADFTRRMKRGEPAPPVGGQVPLCCSHKRADLRARLGSSSRPAI